MSDDGERAQGPRIRRARSGEGPVLAALHLRSALAGFAHIFPPEAPPPRLADLEAHWTAMVEPGCDPTSACFVAERDGRRVGTVIAGRARGEGACGRLARLYVEPDEWGGGIGRLLHDTAVGHLRMHGYRRAELSVLERNDRARRWYERLGWRPTAARIPVFEPAGVVDIVYVIDL